MKTTWLMFLLLLAGPVALQAQFTYTNNGDGTATITGYSGPGGSLVIPSTISNLTVTAIGSQDRASGFYGVNLTSVTIPDSVTNIGKFTFEGCDLTSVTIPGSVSEIGDGAFAFCYDLNGITIPESVTSIGPNAFETCPNMAYATIGDGVTNIEPYTFKYCTNLSFITIPGSVISIGDWAFHNCTGLTNATLDVESSHLCTSCPITYWYHNKRGYYCRFKRGDTSGDWICSCAGCLCFVSCDYAIRRKLNFSNSNPQTT